MTINIEYIVGACLGILFMIVNNYRMQKTFKEKPSTFKYSQSHIYEIVRPLLPLFPEKHKNKNTQSYKYEEKFNVKVIIIANNAYWIKDNVFYTAKIDDDGIDKDSTTVVDIMGMDRVELDKMLFIMDQLRDGESDDSGNSGNQ
jgi:hypothetical protein